MLIRCMQGSTRGSAHFFAAFNPNVLFPTSLLMFSPSFISFIRFFFCVLILFKFLLLFVSSSQLIIYLLFLLVDQSSFSPSVCCSILYISMHTIGNVLTTISLQCSLPQFIANIFRNSFLLSSQSIVFYHSLIPLFALSASFLYPTYYPFLIIILESILLHQRRNPCSSFH